MILVYTGDGKGKTSAALGQVIRALGHGLRVACAQFMKRAGVAGEQVMLARLLGDDFLAGGQGFFKNQKDFPRHRAASQAAMAWVLERLASGVRVFILDESIYALNQGLITKEEIEQVLSLAADCNVHVVFTGRGAPDWLMERADVVTEMVSRKHHLNDGQAAVLGVEF